MKKAKKALDVQTSEIGLSSQDGLEQTENKTQLRNSDGEKQINVEAMKQKTEPTKMQTDVGLRSRVKSTEVESKQPQSDDQLNTSAREQQPGTGAVSRKNSNLTVIIVLAAVITIGLTVGVWRSAKESELQKELRLEREELRRVRQEASRLQMMREQAQKRTPEEQYDRWTRPVKTEAVQDSWTMWQVSSPTMLE